MRKARLTAVCLLALAFGAASLLTSVDAKITKGNTRAAQTKYLMRGIVKPNCGGLGGLLKAGPKTDEEWDTAACNASCLSEMGHVLMADGRCPDKAWADAAKALREGSDAVLAAIEAKDADAANAAFTTATGSCAACHKAHKK
ncbi:hypothetical protein GC176_15210 [bacterium]|nr:hypothetical protein [bacterium]